MDGGIRYTFGLNPRKMNGMFDFSVRRDYANLS